MCTSFVIKVNRVVVGMNFDNSGKFKIALKDNNQFLVLLNINGKYYPSFGMNKNGTFMNDLMVDSNGEGKYKRASKNIFSTTRLLENVLNGEIKFNELNEFLLEKTIVNLPNSSTHCMIIEESGNTYVIEPGRKNINNLKSEESFVVMTNFPLSENIDTNFDDIQGSGVDRYKIAYNMLSERDKDFSVEDGFDVLLKTKQSGGDYPTEFSMIAIPKEQVIYFTINGDFDKKFKFSFHNNKISSQEGFTKNNSCILTSEGIFKSELEKW